MKKIVVTSGYFNPVHMGHLAYFKAAKALGDFHVVIVNNDGQVAVKGSVPFMQQDERLQIVAELKDVDLAVLSVDDDASVCKTLDLLGQLLPNAIKNGCYEVIFANGGDRGKDSIPENTTCEEHGIATVFGVGGDFKMQSSSELIKNSAQAKKDK